MREFIKNGQKVKLETPNGDMHTGTIIGVIPDVATGYTDYIVMLDEQIGEWPYRAVAVSEQFISFDAAIDFDQLANDISDFKA